MIKNTMGSDASRPLKEDPTLTQAESDLAASKMALADSLEARAFLESVLNASKDCIKVLTFDGELVFMNESGQAVMEVDDFGALKGLPWARFWEGTARNDAEQALATARAGGTGHFTGSAKTAKGTDRFWDVTVTHIPGRDSGAGHILSISRDITEAHRLEEQKELLSRELSHRVKNSLSLAQAIATQTFRGSDSGQLATYSTRLAALGAAQSLLLQKQWTSVSTNRLIEDALRPICSAERIALDVEDFEMDGRRALALALALHELGTNAIKYGALSQPGGSVLLSLSTKKGQLELIWREVGGPLVHLPLETGFGTRLITRNLQTDFGGKVELNYLPTGVVLTLSAPL